MKQKVIAIVGPTSSGKSALGVFLARKLKGEIISADSRQVYKGLNIGTGKITKKEMQGVPHHLLDVVSPKKQFSVSDFAQKAQRAITMIYHSEKLPVVVGGTGLYVDVLLGRMSVPEVPPNPKLRARLEKLSAWQLFSMLKRKDPRRAATIEPQHKRRLIRALEIAQMLGKNPEQKVEQPYDVLWIGLESPAAVLKKKIRIRLFARIRSGMIAEAKKIHAGELSYKRMEELGLEYRYLSLLLQNKITKKEFAEQLENAINKYAKRQSRWFKRNPDIRWVKNNTEALRLAKEFLGRAR